MISNQSKMPSKAQQRARMRNFALMNSEGMITRMKNIKNECTDIAVQTRCDQVIAKLLLLQKTIGDTTNESWKAS